MNSISSLLLFCSGANLSILRRCPSELNKYAGIGATVLFTGILAAISAGYALYTVFDSLFSSIAFGLLWGLMIFNLDRYIVSSMKKRGKFLQEFKVAIPRLMLAILLALVISKPLELKIFEKEINRQLDNLKNQEAIGAKKQIGEAYSEVEDLERKRRELQTEINNKENFRAQKQQEYDYERFGVKTPGTTGVSGIGTNAKKKEQQLDAAERDLAETRERNKSKIEEYDKQIETIYSKRDEAFNKQQPNIENYDGLAARIDALSQLARKSPAMNLANLFIILLFIAIETSPIFVKLISPKGPYDDLLHAHEHHIEVFTIEQMSKVNQKTNERLSIIVESGNNAVKEELEGNRNLMKRVVAAEAELAQELINQWKEKEMTKIKSKNKSTNSSDTVKRKEA